MKPSSAPYQPALRACAWILLAATVLAVLVARVRLAGLPLERDEGEYAYGGQLLLLGVAPYKLAYSMKLPGAARCLCPNHVSPGPVDQCDSYRPGSR